MREVGVVGALHHTMMLLSTVRLPAKQHVPEGELFRRKCITHLPSLLCYAVADEPADAFTGARHEQVTDGQYRE